MLIRQTDYDQKDVPLLDYIFALCLFSSGYWELSSAHAPQLVQQLFMTSSGKAQHTRHEEPEGALFMREKIHLDDKQVEGVQDRVWKSL